MMFDVLFGSVVLVASAILWLSGLRLFLRAELSRRRRLVWTACLVGTGGVIGVLPSRPQVWEKFLILLALLPALGAVDIALLRWHDPSAHARLHDAAAAASRAGGRGPYRIA